MGNLTKNVGDLTITVRIKPVIDIGFWEAVKLRILGGRRALAQILNRVKADL